MICHKYLHDCNLAYTCVLSGSGHVIQNTEDGGKYIVSSFKVRPETFLASISLVQKEWLIHHLH